MNGQTGITQEFQDELAGYCLANPDHFGLFLNGCCMCLFSASQARTVLGSWRQNWVARRRPPLPRDLFGGARVLIDASVSGYHASVWLPTAQALLEKGIRIALVGHQPELQPQLARVLGAAPKGSWRYTSIPFESPAPNRTPVFFDPDAPRVPIKGLMGWALEAMKTNLNRLIACWEDVLSREPVEAVLSTNPLGFWSSAMMRAAKKRGVKAIFIQSGMTDKDFYRCYQLEGAAVWSRIGMQGLLDSGWNQCRILMARNPSLFSESAQGEIRRERRRQLGVDDHEQLVLVLGQKAFDVTFRVEGYPETCRLIGHGLAAASRISRRRVLLRPHPGEVQPETEQIIRSCGLGNLLVSSGASLLEDVAAADLSISLHSSALEEAYLSGCPIIQVAAPGIPLNIDFRLIGAPLARESTELRDLILDTSWTQRLLSFEGTRSIGDVLLEFLN